tara:strand:+ start:94 stop:387 length:294 start_codon:yes stop_codon:yes gene_type:complete
MSLNRYQFTKTELGKLKTVKYPEFNKQPSDRYILSRDGDRLDILSNEFYKDPRFWWVLAEANNLGKGTMAVPPGLQLRIPFPIDDLLNRLRDVEEAR